MAEKHYIVQGAQCKCQYGSKPDELEIVQGTDREYINDSDDNQKLIASTIDLQQPFKTKTFGNCSKNNNNACVPSVTQWQDFYKNVTLTKGGHILTEDSKGTCATGTPGCITFITHGQTATVTQAHFGKVEVETLTLLNPLAPNPVPAQKELPQVKTISCKAANNDKATDTRKDKDKKVDGIKIRIDESLDFSVKSYYNEAKADTSKVSWKVIMSSSFKGETLLFESIGPAFKMNFDKPGKYRVVAFGNPAKQDDDDCAVDIEVIENTLKDGPAIAGDHARDKGKQHLIRRGVPVTAKARFEIEPATPAEISGVSMVAKDAAGNLLASSAGTGLLLFTPANRAAQYTVTASMTSLTGTVKEVTETYTTEENVVMAITCDKTGDFFRPGTSLSFTAKTLYTGALEDFEAQQIKWQLDGKDVATGNVFTTPASLKPGDHIVEAYVSKANAALKKENDDYHFTIGDNYVESLKVIKGSNNWLLGKRYNLEVVTKMPYVPASDGNILWTDTQGKSYSGNGTGLKNAACIKTGDHTITARTYRQEKPAVLPIKCTAAGIIRWCITDEDGNFRNYAGWNETLVAHIQSATGMAGEKIHVHLLEAKDKNEGAILTESPTSYLKDLGETTFDEQGNASINFKTDDALKQQLGKKGTIGHWNSYEGNQYELMLVASPMDIVLEGMNTTMIDNNKYLSPSVATREVKREKGIFTLLDNKQDIVSIHFLRKNGKDAYSIIPYGEDIEIKVRTRNLEGTKLKLNIIWNKLAKGTEEEEQGTVVTVKNETASWTLHTGALKTKVQKAKIDLRRITLWQVEITDKDGDTFRYPDVRLQDKTLDWKKLLTYQTLKLSDNTAIGADAVKSAPVVVGEPLEPVSNTGTCICKEYDLIWGNKVSCEFRKKVVEICRELWPNDYKNMANNLMACMALETGGTFNPHDSNDNGYFGLIGFGESSVQDIKTTRAHIMSIDGVEQLNWVKKRFEYIQKHLMNNGKGGTLSDFTDLYLAVIYPTKSGLGAGENAKDKIIFDASIDKKHMLEYRQNPSFMKEPGEYEHKQQVTFKRRVKGELIDVTETLRGYSDESKAKTYRWEITEEIKEWYIRGENNKAKNYTCSQAPIDATNNTACPADCSQCFEYADVWDNPEISSDNGGKNNNRYGYNSKREHKGIDILSGPIYKTVHSLMCGEVVSSVTSFKTNEYRAHSLGNTLMIKSKDKDGKEVFILYCHLDKVYVKKGNKIKHGQAIALSGSTGNASYSGLPNGVKGHGIDKKYWHVHIEAATKGDGYNNFYSLGSYRIKAEDYMKTKFDANGNAIK